MKISFDTEELRQLCCEAETTYEVMGSTLARDFLAFIADIEASSSAEEAAIFLGNDIAKLNENSVSFVLDGQCEIKMIAVGTKFSTSDSGSVLWSTVTRLKLISVRRLG